MSVGYDLRDHLRNVGFASKILQWFKIIELVVPPQQIRLYGHNQRSYKHVCVAPLFSISTKSRVIQGKVH